MMNKPILAPSSFWMFLVDLLSQMLQNLPSVMLVNILAWRGKFLMNSTLSVKDYQYVFDLTCLTFFKCGEDGLRGLLSGF